MSTSTNDSLERLPASAGSGCEVFTRSQIEEAFASWFDFERSKKPDWHAIDRTTGIKVEDRTTYGKYCARDLIGLIHQNAKTEPRQ